MLIIFADGWDHPAIEWILANWQWIAAGIVALLGYRNKDSLMSGAKSVLGVKSTSTPAPEPTEGDNRADLAAYLCAWTDHVHALKDQAGIDACTVLAPMAMLLPEPPETTTTTTTTK